MVRKVVMNLDLSKASGPDCIPVVVLKNCESELSFILAELFNKCLKESSVVACTCNPASEEAEFRNGVGSIPVGGNSPLIGG